MKMYNQRFKIHRPTVTANEFGEQVQALTLVGTRWGKVKELRGDFYPEGTSQKWLNVLQLETKHYPNHEILLTDLIEYSNRKYRILDIQVKDDDTFKYYTVLKLTSIE